MQYAKFEVPVGLFFLIKASVANLVRTPSVLKDVSFVLFLLLYRRHSFVVSSFEIAHTFSKEISENQRQSHVQLAFKRGCCLSHRAVGSPAPRAEAAVGEDCWPQSLQPAQPDNCVCRSLHSQTTRCVKLLTAAAHVRAISPLQSETVSDPFHLRHPTQSKSTHSSPTCCPPLTATLFPSFLWAEAPILWPNNQRTSELRKT